MSKPEMSLICIRTADHPAFSVRDLRQCGQFIKVLGHAGRSNKISHCIVSVIRTATLADCDHSFVFS